MPHNTRWISASQKSCATTQNSPFSFPNRTIHLASRLIRLVRAVRLPRIPQRGLSSQKSPRDPVTHYMVLKGNRTLLLPPMNLHIRQCPAAQRGQILTKWRARWQIDCLRMWIQKCSVSYPETSSRSCYQVLSPAPLSALLAMSPSHSPRIQWQIAIISRPHRRASWSLLTGMPQESSRALRVWALWQDRGERRSHSLLTALFLETWTPRCFRSSRRMFKGSCFPNGSSRSWSWRAPRPGNQDKASRLRTKKLQEKTAKQTICSSILNLVKEQDRVLHYQVVGKCFPIVELSLENRQHVKEK